MISGMPNKRIGVFEFCCSPTTSILRYFEFSMRTEVRPFSRTCSRATRSRDEVGASFELNHDSS
jgi:hypothetical protein